MKRTHQEVPWIIFTVGVGLFPACQLKPDCVYVIPALVALNGIAIDAFHYQLGVVDSQGHGTTDDSRCRL
ncbi:MAG: hypothetical protein JEZ00_15055 [Anaerolineaceae bacterium]|nr:hypothetical protein [Anaerolineaceae bacterium]